MSKIFDVLIVGAGAAGLACAEKLLEKGKTVLLVESQKKVGGRATSLLKDGFPVHYGAEFIHGYPKSSKELMKKLGADFYDVDDRRFVFSNGRLKPQKNFWDLISRYTDKIKKSHRQDRSIQEFLNTQRDSISLKMFASFVEGFHAADLNLIGEKGFIDAEQVEEENDLNGCAMFRPLKGYSHLWDTWLKADKKVARSLRLDSTVKKIDYAGSVIKVDVLSQNKFRRYLARKVVVTSSVGALKSSPQQSSYIHWNPGPPANLTRFLDAVEMGHIQKITFKFKSRFWEELSKEKASFYHDEPISYFPTWWNHLPLRVPYLVAWQGGVKALEMSTWKEQQVVDCALDSLARIFKKTRHFVDDQFIQYHYKNWSADENFLGAYTNIHVNGLSGSRALRKSLDRKIFFAGEATEVGSSRGTVHGALNSGVRVAREILR